jgi:hypothetical protein
MARSATTRRRLEDSPPARGPFLRRVRTVLENTSHEELKRHLLERAKSLSAEERVGFLLMLAEGERRSSETHSGVVAEVEAFVAALRRNDYPDDPWSGDEPEWVDHFETLLSLATKAFLGGERAVAAEAFGRLLRVFELEGEVAAFCSEEPAEFRVRSDLDEVLALHLRALYETTPHQQRAARLLEEIIALRHIGRARVGLQAIMNADAEPLEDLERFLPAWIEALRRLDPDRDVSPWNVRGPLLREATLLAAGADGLGELARHEGNKEPRHYHEWLDALLCAGRREDAVAAAREAVDAMKDPWQKARLADRLTTLAVDGGDETLAIEASLTAWRSRPSLRRLRWLCGAGDPDDETLRARLDAENEAARRGKFRLSARLAAVLDLLLGDLSSALNRLTRARSLGWSRGEHPGPIVFPCALLAAAELATPPERSLLAELWDEMDDGIDDDYVSDLEYTEQDEPGRDGSRAHADGSPEPPTLDELLSTTLGRLELPPGTRRRVLERARRVVEKRAAAIVSGKHRRAYARAARLAAAWAEGASLAGSPDSGPALLRALCERHSRYSAFKREINAVSPRGISRRQG